MITAEFRLDSLFVIGYTFICFSLAPVIGKYIGKAVKLDYPHFSHFLLTSCEGGNLVLPLYITIAGAGNAGNVVLIDIAGIFIAFIVLPVIIIRKTSGAADIKTLLLNVIKDPFVIAVASALILNLSGAYGAMEKTAFFPFYEQAISYMTTPITSLILFIVGYDLKFEAKMMPSLIKLILIRAGIYALVIAGYFLLFPGLMAEKLFMMAVILYFTATTGFAVLLQVYPLCKNEEERHFASAFVSTYILLELAVYVLVVVFMT